MSGSQLVSVLHDTTYPCHEDFCREQSCPCSHTPPKPSPSVSTAPIHCPPRPRPAKPCPPKPCPPEACPPRMDPPILIKCNPCKVELPKPGTSMACASLTCPITRPVKPRPVQRFSAGTSFSCAPMNPVSNCCEKQNCLIVDVPDEKPGKCDGHHAHDGEYPFLPW